MAKKITRLHFTEEDLSDKKVSKAASKAEAAADQAERAIEKLPKKRTLRFEKVDGVKPSAVVHSLTRAPTNFASAKAHQMVRRDGDDNNGVQAAHFTESTVEGAVRGARHQGYSRKLKQYKKAEQLERKADGANVKAMYQKSLKDNPEAASNPISKWRQKQTIKKEYAAMRAEHTTGATSTSGTAASGTKKTTEGMKSMMEKAFQFVGEHSNIMILLACAALFILVIAGLVSSCSVLMNSSGNILLGTSFTAENQDILGADEDYTALETELRREIDNIESTHSGYDEYRYNLAEIGHNPYELAALLTVEYEDYTRDEIQGRLREVFEAQYQLTLTEEVEIRTRTVHSTSTDPETGEESDESYEEDYEYYILNVTLTNIGVRAVVRGFGMSDDQQKRYDVLLETRGNRDDLFGDVSFAVPGGEYTDYDIPGEALTDERFRNMIKEAEKYLGYPYVWGGSSPRTSFDCSGFVSWVINQCGNGWNVGRQTANGLLGYCDIIPKSQARPGDLIFFQGTYNTSGASHIGIYVGGGMMIHCGSPISYASIESDYWKKHYYCMGRIR